MGKNTCHNPPELNFPCLAFLHPSITSPLRTAGVVVAPEGWECVGEAGNAPQEISQGTDLGSGWEAGLQIDL